MLDILTCSKTISTWGRTQLNWGRTQLPSCSTDCINFLKPAYSKKQPRLLWKQPGNSLYRVFSKYTAHGWRPANKDRPGLYLSLGFTLHNEHKVYRVRLPFQKLEIIFARTYKWALVLRWELMDSLWKPPDGIQIRNNGFVLNVVLLCLQYGQRP